MPDTEIVLAPMSILTGTRPLSGRAAYGWIAARLSGIAGPGTSRVLRRVCALWVLPAIGDTRFEDTPAVPLT